MSLSKIIEQDDYLKKRLEVLTNTFETNTSLGYADSQQHEIELRLHEIFLKDRDIDLPKIWEIFDMKLCQDIFTDYLED
tara:strand:+ start:42 stop:278 length:237 start_codon:yes stop_codon:yes gene_type:complete